MRLVAAGKDIKIKKGENQQEGVLNFDKRTVEKVMNTIKNKVYPDFM